MSHFVFLCRRMPHIMPACCKKTAILRQISIAKNLHTVVYSIYLNKDSLMKYLIISIFSLFCLPTFAALNDINIPVNEANSPAYPVENASIASEDSQGNRILSLRSNINPRSENPLTQAGYSEFKMAWSYGRGIGRIPNSCPEGFTADFFGCKQGNKRIGKQCAVGQQKQAGLCYKKCASNFKGIGPMCHGNLGDLNLNEVSPEVQAQHQAAVKNASQPGIALKNKQAPRLKTDIMLKKLVCGNGMFLNLASSKLPALVNKSWSQVLQKNGSKTIYDKTGKMLWVRPGLSEFVMLDFAVDGKCTDNNERANLKLGVNTSITVKVSSKMFDPALHNISGVSIGVAKMSIYELIPFRIYGSVGSTLGAKVAFESNILKEQAPVIFNGRANAHESQLTVDPKFNLWLGAEAYLRIPGFLSKDFLQLGAKFKLTAVDWHAPYKLYEGIDKEQANHWKLDETLYSNLQAGSGSITPFFNIMGIQIKSFTQKYSKQWAGKVKQNEALLIRKGSYPL